MNKKIYTTPNIDVVELQGEVVLAAVSGGGVKVNDGGGMSDPEINFGNGTLSNGDQAEALSGGYFKVWDDEE
ncbi:hypothetical protein [uncultured Prevotella sp.]|uniref:hypothetical protein n=1 Tax=uncultured Prevotella sp. TaxID=159272 RepID=UPI002624106E|nr:hypothetical protein [uncultured Prevotella sp.]